LTTKSEAGTLSPLAIEGSIDPNCPVFAQLNHAFSEVSWDDTLQVASFLRFFLESLEKTPLVLLFQHWTRMLTDLLHIQTLHYKVIVLAEQTVTLEVVLKVEDEIIKASS